ncbi:multiple RNA-binding domain-containing protein 1 [Nematocida sp. AWRm78]|nr:multiple RNA-binding domain-containing protein 1 [Nematocida sp. AWRm78]
MRIIVKNLPVTATKQDIKEHFSAKGIPTDVRLLSTMRGESRGVAFIGYKTEEESEASIVYYNRAYYNGNKLVVQKSESKEARNRSMHEDRPVKHQKALSDGLEVGEMKEILKLLQAKKENAWSITVDDESPEKEKKEKKEESLEDIVEKYRKSAETKNKEKVMETGEVFINGIPYTTTEEEVEKEFSKYGMVAEVFMKYKERTDSWGEGHTLNTGFAIVTYTFPKYACKILGETILFQGKHIKVLPSRGKPVEEVTDKNKSNLSHGRYNPVFFNFTAILGVASKEKKVSKRDILKDRGIGVGGKIALLESELIERTRMFLKDEGISEECTCSKKPCICMFISKKSILVKNIPYGIREGEIREHFTKYIRAVFSPSKTLIILEYGTKSDAMAELKQNNFTRIRDQPIYIEYLKVTKERYAREMAGLPPVSGLKSAENELKKEKEDPLMLKLILKNVPFQAGRGELSELLTGLIGTDYTLRMPLKADGTHRGFCFVEMQSSDAANTLLRKLRHVHLYGRHIVAEKAQV